MQFGRDRLFGKFPPSRPSRPSVRIRATAASGTGSKVFEAIQAAGVVAGSAVTIGAVMYPLFKTQVENLTKDVAGIKKDLADTKKDIAMIKRKLGIIDD